MYHVWWTVNFDYEYDSDSISDYEYELISNVNWILFSVPVMDNIH